MHIQKIQNLDCIKINDSDYINHIDDIAQKLLDVDMLSNQYQWTLDKWKQSLISNDIYILKNDAEIIGICVWLDNSIIKEMELIQIIISKNYMGKGIAFDWLNYFFTLYSGFTLRLEVRASNLVAQNLYKKCRFDIIGERKNYYPIYENKQIISRENAIIMEKIIAT
jgi:ribosomal-protein-alanine N-acetyltransferase